MENIIQVRGLTFKYDQEYVFRDLTLEIEKNKFTTILGANGVGKTTLTKLLSGEYNSNRIIIDGIHLPIHNLRYIKTFTSVISDDSQLNEQNKVIDELNITYEKEGLEDLMIQITRLLGINKLLNKKIQKLNVGEKQLVLFARSLIQNPKILIIDESLDKLDEEIKEKILMFLKDMTKLRKMTVIYLTSNSNDSLYSDNIIIIGDKQIIAAGKKEQIYDNEQIFKQAKLKLPFIIELSKKLQFYNLTDKTYINAEKMVEDLWK